MQGLDPKTLRSSIQIYRELASRQPENPAHRERLGRLYLLAGRHERGLTEVEVAARLRSRRGEYATAIELVRDVLRVAPRRTSAALLLAQLYAQAPHMASRVSVAAAVQEDPLEEIGRGDSAPPLDASSLVAVHEAEEMGAELDVDQVLPEDDPFEPLGTPVFPAEDSRAHRVLRHALDVATTYDRTLSEDVDEADILQIIELVPEDDDAN